MKEYTTYNENLLYTYDKEIKVFKLYTDEFEKLLLKHGLELGLIETDDCNVEFTIKNCEDAKKINCKKFQNILENKIPNIKDILIETNGEIIVSLIIDSESTYLC